MPIPHPGQDRGFPYTYDAEADALIADFDAGKDAVPRPEQTTELYLKLAALDPDDVEGLVRFVSAYGSLDMRGTYSVANPFGGWMFPIRHADDVPAELIAAWERAVTVAADHYGMAGAVSEIRRADDAYGLADTVTEIRYAVLYMRDLIAARRALQGEIDPTTHEWEAPFWAGWGDLDSPPWTPEGPASALSGALDDGLAPYSPHIRTFSEGQEPADLWGGEVGTWHVCCLELFNHIVEDAKYTTCANERCGRLFVRQEGRALHGQHRTRGVKYCSRECARAQAQRDYRRRKRKPR